MCYIGLFYKKPLIRDGIVTFAKLWYKRLSRLKKLRNVCHVIKFLRFNLIFNTVKYQVILAIKNTKCGGMILTMHCSQLGPLLITEVATRGAVGGCKNLDKRTSMYKSHYGVFLTRDSTKVEKFVRKGFANLLIEEKTVELENACLFWEHQGQSTFIPHSIMAHFAYVTKSILRAATNCLERKAS